ncbi:hypothetical protein FJY84_02120 [Candidatus Bathyarchaeota archaeon]|nr:hypothetical protein [Candidatus Bathyarchaeota archaeon]
MGETKQGFNLFKAFADYDRRIIHATMMIVMIIFLLLPLKLPLIVSEQTNKYYNILNNIKPGDKVLFVFDCEPSGFQELRSGIIATMRMLLEREAKIAVIIGVPESIALPGIVIDTLQEIWTRKATNMVKIMSILGMLGQMMLQFQHQRQTGSLQ